MKTTATFLLSILACSVQFSHVSAQDREAQCYLTGETLDYSQALYHLRRACHGYDGIAGAFQGWFNPGQEKYACVNTPGNVKYEMSVKNQNTQTGFDLDDDYCSLRLTNILDRCVTGGTYNYAGWGFRLDPNAGRC